MKRLFLTCALAVFTALPALAAENPWVGTWKLDAAKSNFTGDTFTFSKAANGKLHYSDGSTETYDFAVDGKPYKSYGNRTSAWTADGDHAWKQVVEADGKTIVTVHRELSADGKTFTNTYSGTKPDGTTFNDEAIYTRVTGSKGLLGKWRSTKVTVSAPDDFIVSSPASGILHWDIPAYKETVEGKAGAELPVQGSTVPPGMTFSYRMVTSHKLSYTIKLDGKPQAYGIQTLAADGKSFTDVSWNAGKASEKQTGFYARQ